MSNEQVIDQSTIIACEIAAGRIPLDAAENAISVRASYKDLNCKGKGPECYRMVWRGGQWVYFADERLPSGSFRAADRRATVYGDVYPGELVCEHPRGGRIEAMWLVRSDPKPLWVVRFVRARDGLHVTLPSGTSITVPDPRS